MSNNTDKLIALFIECYSSCELSTKIAIHNTYHNATNPTIENEIESNDEDFFIKSFEDSPMEAVRAALYGDYRYNDDWVWFNDKGDLVSGDTEDNLPLTDPMVMAEWYIENYGEIDFIEEMGLFCDECEQNN